MNHRQVIVATISTIVITVVILLGVRGDARACPDGLLLECVGVRIDDHPALPYINLVGHEVDQIVSEDPTFWYEILDDRGVDLLGRVRLSALQVERWSPDLQTWASVFSAAAVNAFPLVPQTNYHFSALPSLMPVRDFYGNSLTAVPPLDPGKYRLAFSVVADNPLTSVVGFTVGSSPARSSGITLSPDETHVIITKDVGDERWVIFHYMLHRTIIGNVFFREGRDPVFLFCKYTGSTLADYSGVFDYECYSSPSCGEVPCGTKRDWHFIADVALPGQFFLPPGQEGGTPTQNESPTLLPQDLQDELAHYFGNGPSAETSLSLSAAMGVGTERQSGIQLSPQRIPKVLVSKDVGSDRWSLVYVSFGVLTGSVFDSSGTNEPAFFWCSDDRSTEKARCWVANSCEHAPCLSDWHALGTVALPNSFVTPPGGLDDLFIEDPIDE